MPLKILNDKLFKYDHFRLSSDFLLEVSESTHSVVLVQLNEIVTKCVKLEHDDRVYLIEMPNMIEME